MESQTYKLNDINAYLIYFWNNCNIPTYQWLKPFTKNVYINSIELKFAKIGERSKGAKIYHHQQKQKRFHTWIPSTYLCQ